MKTLKITLLLVAVLLLTVSGVKSDGQSENNTATDKNYKIDLLAHGKKKLEMPTQG